MALQKATNLAPVRYNKDTEFVKELRKRVRAYFKDNNKTVHGDWRMYIKTAFMLALYFTPFIMIVAGVVTSNWGVFGMFCLMGVGLSGIGLSIMHDANHEAYSSKKRINRWMGDTVNMVGGYAPTWRYQHNVLHHTYTNITGKDEDIDPGGLMRFSPHTPKKYMHRFQFLYAWFFYGLMTFFWVTFKDFMQIKRYKKMGILQSEGVSYRRLVLENAIWKVIYYSYIFIPLFVFTSIPVWLMLLGFFSLHFVAGVILGCIFQPAHVMTETEFPMPNNENNIENNWAIHQLLTTANFAKNNRILSWFIGGLNYQIEHHLFPNICHIHYRAISPIIKQTAKEYGLPYHEQKTFVGALWNHTKMLYKLGRIEGTEYKEYPVLTGVTS
jgi:linoleoyl-CoA desaturase